VRLVFLAAAGVAAFLSSASAQTLPGYYPADEAPYSQPAPEYPIPGSGWPWRPRAYYAPDLTEPAPAFSWPWLSSLSRHTFFGGRKSQYYCHSAVDRRGVQTTACETNDPADFHDMR